MNFYDLINLVLEGDFNPLYDAHHSELSPQDIQRLSKAERKGISLKDKSKREFSVIVSGKEIKTHATTKNAAIGNVAYNMSLDDKLNPAVVVKRLHEMGAKVYDNKWSIKY
jgi:hypothetical protein